MSRKPTPRATRITASKPLVDLARLDSLPLGEVRELWRAYGCRGEPPQRRFMIREIAFRAQAHIYGDFDPLTRRLLKAAMRHAFDDRRASPAASASTTTPPRALLSHTTAALPTGARLVRAWRGRTYEVTVVENGKAFVYDGTTYRSLSRVAEVITGSVWSGPKFFGLFSRARGGSRKGGGH